MLHIYCVSTSYFEDFSDVIPEYLDHPEMSQKSKVVSIALCACPQHVNIMCINKRKVCVCVRVHESQSYT